MFAKGLVFFAAFFLTAASAAVDVNRASEAELDGIKGIGPPTSRLIIAEREKSEFRSWDDFIARVKGVGAKSAARFSAEGMTVNGSAYLAGTQNNPQAGKKHQAAIAVKSTTGAAEK